MGEAKRRRGAREAAYAEARKWRLPEACPACGSDRIGRDVLPAHLRSAIGSTELELCLSCKAIWEPFPAGGIEEDPVCADPCDNCAFRPGSPEQQDREGWRKLIASLDPDPETGIPRGRFYCHKAVPIDLTKGPGNFLFPTRPDGQFDEARMRTCSGFLRMVWTKNAKRRSEVTP